VTDEIATPFGYKKLDDCTTADLEFAIAYRNYLHARFPVPTWNIAGLPSTTRRSLI
jgi:hypothetical protein